MISAGPAGGGAGFKPGLYDETKRTTEKINSVTNLIQRGIHVLCSNTVEHTPLVLVKNRHSIKAFKLAIKNVRMQPSV